MRRWQREMDNADAPDAAKAIDAEREAAIRRSEFYDGDAIDWLAEPEPNAVRTCRCGQPAAPQAYLLMGSCSRNCMNDALGETDSDVRD